MLQVKIDTNYAFAFLHGIVHPLSLLPFTVLKPGFLLVVCITGCITVSEYWLLDRVLKWKFVYTKFVLAVTTAVLGFAGILGFRPSVMLAAILTGSLLSAFSHVMLEKVITAATWTRFFPGLVAGQLVIYLGGFMGVWCIVGNT